jgi:hypothetical protein
MLRPIILSISLLILVQTPAVGEDLNATIQYLLAYVKNSEVVFIRNDHEHNSHEAAVHMQRKYAHFKDKIKTPEDFIRLTATKSLVTGREYQIRTREGITISAKKWLQGVLKEYRGNKPIYH